MTRFDSLLAFHVDVHTQARRDLRRWLAGHLDDTAAILRALLNGEIDGNRVSMDLTAILAAANYTSRDGIRATHGSLGSLATWEMSLRAGDTPETDRHAALLASWLREILDEAAQGERADLAVSA